MSKIFHWLLKPPVLALIGVLILALLIWFEGPLLAFADNKPLETAASRWTLILILLLVWALWFGVRWLLAKQAEAKLAKAVAAEPAAPGAAESAAELATLGKRFHESLTLLRKAHGKQRGGNYLYDIPWYLLVGPPGTGKTTALTESGLKFPLAEHMGKGPVGGVGGTRNCDWWFTDEAVLLDTAGRYTTQDSFVEADRAAWLGFLGLLRKHRRRQPINGVIVAISATDMLQLGDAERKAHALAIRERIKELHEQLQMRFPIYVLVTKCDMLAGFVEFFDPLGRDERNQVWGASFPLVDVTAVDRSLDQLPQELQLLEQQLQQRLLDRLQQERDLSRRALIYGFPQQFSLLADGVRQFLDEVFRSTRYEEPALLRGLYFSSATQQGSPIDRIIGSLAGSFGLSRSVLTPNAASGRSYFLNRLLQDVVFHESGLAGANQQVEQRRKWLQWGAMAATAVLVLGLVAGLTVSYFRNQQYLADTATRAAELEQMAKGLRGSNLAEVLPLLQAVRTLPGGYADRDKGVPLLNRFGLNQTSNVGDQAIEVYQRLLTDAFLPLMVTKLETDLRRGDALDADQRYEALRVYLMLGDRKHLDLNAVRAWASATAGSVVALNTEQRAQMTAHVAAWAESINSMPSIANDASLVASTRAALAGMAPERRVYSLMRRQLANNQTLQPFDIAAIAGKEAAQVLLRRSGKPLSDALPGLYTLAGYAAVPAALDAALHDVAKDDWIIGNTSSGGNLSKETVLQLYYDDYIKQWDALLADVVVVPFSGLDHAARVSNLLAAADSPLRKFLRAAASETSLDYVAANQRSALDKMRSKLESMTESAPPVAPLASRNPVDVHFDDLHRLVAAPLSGGAAPLDLSLAALKEVSVFLDAANAAKRTGSPAPPADAVIRLKRETEGKPVPLSAMMQSVSNAAASLTQGGERERLSSLWMANVAPFCRQAIAGRYPLARGQAKEITLDDFGRFFAPNGLVDDFFQKNLQQYVDMSANPWKLRASGADSLGIPAEVLAEFQRAARIRDTFFIMGGTQPSFRFQLKPLTFDPVLTRINIDIEGNVLSWVPGPAGRPIAFQVPGGKGVIGSRLEYAPSASGGEIRSDGPWSLLRLLDRGLLTNTAQAERYQLNFNLEGRQASFELTASSVMNPFRRDVLERFRCLDRL